MGEFRRHLLRGVKQSDFRGKVTADAAAEDMYLNSAWGGAARWTISEYVNEQTRCFAINSKKATLTPHFQAKKWLERIDKMPRGWTSSNGVVFTNCANLERVDLTGGEWGGRTSLWRMFAGCGKLREVVMPDAVVEHAVGLNEMFSNCAALEEADVSAFKNVSSVSYMFNGCSGLRSVKFAEDMVHTGTNFAQVFFYCSQLESVDFGTADFSAVNNQYRGFWCGTGGPRSIRMRGVGGNETKGIWQDCFRVANWGDGSEENRQSILYTLLEHSCDRVANGWETDTIGLLQSVLNRLTAEEKAAIEAKGYTLKRL